jgi:hypothetical protein
VKRTLLKRALFDATQELERRLAALHQRESSLPGGEKIKNWPPFYPIVYHNIEVIHNKHAYAGATDSFTHLRVLLVLNDRGILAQSNLRR